MGLPRTPVAGNNNQFVVTCTINGSKEQVTLNQEEYQYFQAAPKEQQQILLERLHADHQHRLAQEQQPLLRPAVVEAPLSNPPPQFASTPSEKKELPRDEEKTQTSFTIPRNAGQESPISTENSEDEEIDQNSPSQNDEEDPIQNVDNWTYTETEEQMEKDQRACHDRLHEFEKRAKSILAVPAKRFQKAYRTFLVQFDKNVFGDTISKEFGDKLLDEVKETYGKMEEAREKCLEVLTQQDLEKNPRYGQYLDDRFEELCTCQRIYQKYFEEEQKLEEHLQSQHQQKLRQDIRKQPQNQPPPIMQQPYPGQVFVYQQPSHLPIKLRPSPTVVKQPIYSPEANTDPAFMTMGPPINTPMGSQHPTAFKVYNDPSRIPTPSGPSEVFEPQYQQYHHLKFRLKDELEVIEPFDGSKPQEYLRFRVQWENLDNKMNQQRHISELDKYNALRKVLSGSAKQLIDTKYPNHESYRRSIDKLEGMYYKPRLHGTEVIQSLSKFDKMTDTYESLMRGYNRLKDSWDDLEHMKLSKGELKGLLLIVANEKNLSDDTWQIWHSIQNDPRYSENYMECLNAEVFLGAIHTAMNNAQRRQSVVGRRLTQDYKPKPKSTLYGSYNATMTSNQKETTKQAGTGCVFCQRATHHRYQLYCPELKSMDPDKIWQIMRQNGITCQMCLCLGHSTRGCEAVKNGNLKKCSIKDDKNEICGKFHCRFLHQAPKKGLTQKEESNTPEESVATDQQ